MPVSAFGRGCIASASSICLAMLFMQSVQMYVSLLHSTSMTSFPDLLQMQQLFISLYYLFTRTLSTIPYSLASSAVIQ